MFFLMVKNNIQQKFYRISYLNVNGWGPSNVRKEGEKRKRKQKVCFFLFKSSAIGMGRKDIHKF